MKRFDNALRLLLALALVIPFVAGHGIRSAYACSGPGVPEPAKRFAPGSDAGMPGTGSIAFLGQVLGEAELEVPFNSAYLSEVQTIVPLAGDAIPGVVRVGPHGFGAPDCSGGPRLFAGEKVMLFLYPSRGVLGGEADPSYYGDWQSGQFGTPILFDGDDAYYLSWGRFSDQGEGADMEQRFYVGDSAEVLELALTYFDVTPEEREQAYQFVLGTSAPATPTIAPSPPAPMPTAPSSAGGVHISPPDTGSGGLLSTGPAAD